MKEKRSTNAPQAKVRGPGAETNAPGARSASWIVALLALAVAAVASGMLVLEHFGAMELPGCGRGSPCARAAASVYGTVPGLGLPTSFVGFAYFTAALVALIVGRGRVSGVARWIGWIGGLASLAFIGIVFVERLPCAYCLTVHGANLAFVAIVEVRTRAERTQRGAAPLTAPRAGAPVGIGLTVFALALIALGVANTRVSGRVQQKAETELAESTSKMIGAAHQDAPKPTPGGDKPHAAPASAGTSAPGKANTPPPATAPTPSGFSGRHQFGPDKAVARVVMFTDYQCPDCYRLEGELRSLMASDADISVIIKQFPMCTDCNPKASNMHANACWAARAAIAAGMIRGNEGFWQMHDWLFSQRGSFTDQSFPASLAQMGYDSGQFTAIMQSQATLDEVKKDIDEAYALGIYYTPMIFINGVELKGWNAPQALTRAVQAVIAANPPKAEMSNDHPPTALEKYLADWRERPVQAIPDSITKRFLGPAGAPVTVVVFGDYQEDGTREVDGLMRLFATGPDSNMKYVFAYFPVDQSCNPSTEMTKFAGGCRAAMAAEAADVMGGPDTFWKMHNWIMISKGTFTDQNLDQEAAFEGMDPAVYHEAIANSATRAKIVTDAAAAKALGIQSIPLVFINGKQVPRWKLDNENLLPRMVREAAEKK